MCVKDKDLFNAVSFFVLSDLKIFFYAYRGEGVCI